MKKGVKIFLGVGCGLLLIGAAGILLLIVGAKILESQFSAASERSETEGREFGMNTDQQGCINEGLRRSRSAPGYSLGDSVATLAFVETCLNASRPTPGFCDGVPSYWDPQDSEWKLAECRKAGMDEVKTGCMHVFKAKHNHCSPAF